jgi:putative transcriptional regulator
MMSIGHHVGDELLAEYASGALSEGWGIAVATHLALCPQCRRRLATLEAVGGELLDEIAAATVSDSAWSSLAARIGHLQQAPATKPARQPLAGQITIPEPLRSYVGARIDDIKWSRLGSGAAQVLIKTGDASATVRLLKIPAGKPVPEHSHGGRELTLVLRGSFHDSTGTYGPAIWKRRMRLVSTSRSPAPARTASASPSPTRRCASAASCCDCCSRCSASDRAVRDKGKTKP